MYLSTFVLATAEFCIPFSFQVVFISLSFGFICSDNEEFEHNSCVNVLSGTGAGSKHGAASMGQQA